MKKLTALFLLLFMISSCFAFNIQIIPVDSSVKPGESILFDIALNNPATTNKTVIMYVISDKLIPSFSPSYQVIVPAGESLTVNFMAPISLNINKGRYYDSIYFDIGGVIQTSQTISYTVEGPEQYFIFNGVSVPSQIDPRNEFNLVLNFENAYNEMIQRMYASIEIYKEDGTSLYYASEIINTPLGNNSVNIPIKLDSSLTPTTANARVSLTWYDISFGSKVEQFSIIGYADNTTQIVSGTSITTTTTGFLIKNEGTLVIHGFDYEAKINSLEAYFITSASVPYTLTSNSIIFHVPELYPGDSVELTYKLNYSILYLLPFLVLGIVYLMYYFTRTVSVTREIFEFKSSTNSISFKVVINLSNVSKDKVNHVKVKEYLPVIISEVFDYGTLHGEIKTDRFSRKYIEWNLGKLKPGENVILSYRMRSKIGYVGELQLDRTIVEVLDSRGKTQSTVHTNTILVDIGARKEENIQQPKKTDKKL